MKERGVGVVEVERAQVACDSRAQFVRGAWKCIFREHFCVLHRKDFHVFDLQAFKIRAFQVKIREFEYWLYFKR